MCLVSVLVHVVVGSIVEHPELCLAGMLDGVVCGNRTRDGKE